MYIVVFALPRKSVITGKAYRYHPFVALQYLRYQKALPNGMGSGFFYLNKKAYFSLPASGR